METTTTTLSDTHDTQHNSADDTGDSPTCLHWQTTALMLKDVDLVSFCLFVLKWAIVEGNLKINYPLKQGIPMPKAERLAVLTDPK